MKNELAFSSSDTSPIDHLRDCIGEYRDTSVFSFATASFCSANLAAGEDIATEGCRIRDGNISQWKRKKQEGIEEEGGGM